MNRTEGLLVQSAPATVGMLRSPSFSTAEDVNPFTISAYPRSMVPSWQATNDETRTAYTFGSGSTFSREFTGLYPTTQQVSGSQVPGLHVFTPSEYVDSLSDPLSASSMQSAPAVEDMQRSLSSFSTAEDANPLNVRLRPISVFGREIAGLYPTMQQVSESEVPGLHVFTPSEYVDSLSDPSSASLMQSAHIPAHQDPNRLPASQSSSYIWSPSSDGSASPNTPTSGEITAESAFTGALSNGS